ncbi:neuropeptide B [Nothoprocta perdicaria]|uniref:Neuropeptide B n=1 Tax=Nothoprocta perdicaria TaxID=30464 RepID=A0A8C6ZFU9_NOTPE|nr:neuropeptide B [Nothoprocta perdicaria]
MNAARCLVLALALALLCRPAAPWYRQAARPTYYSVGRASGLLSSLRRSPYTRRSGTDSTAERGPSARPLAAVPCVTDVSPELHGCQLLPGAPGSLQCKANVTMSLDPQECTGA